MATEVEAFQISERQSLRPGRLTVNTVDTQVSDKQHGTLNLSISKIQCIVRNQEGSKRAESYNGALNEEN